VLDWLTWPADLLLNFGGWVASWFVSQRRDQFRGRSGDVRDTGASGRRDPDCILANVSWILAVALEANEGGRSARIVSAKAAHRAPIAPARTAGWPIASTRAKAAFRAAWQRPL
jgi:hypothetical protein